MRIKSIVISLIILLLSLTKVNAQIDYDLRLKNCIVNDTLYISVIVDNNGNDLIFANSNFVFDISQNGVKGDTTGLLFSDKFIAYEGPWSAAAGNAPDYQQMTLGSDVPNFPYFNLSINVDQTPGNSGYTIISGTSDSIGVIGIPLTNSWCGDTIDLVWRDVVATTWLGHPFQRGDILEWNDPTFPSIYNDANFINPASFILCEGCGGSALSYSISPIDPTVCEGDSIDFFLSPTPISGDTISFYVDGVLAQQSVDTLYRDAFNNNVQVYAVIGNPSCVACGTISDTTNVSITPVTLFDLLITPFGCDSIQLEALAGYSNYEVTINSSLVYSGPLNGGNVQSTGSDTIIIIATGGSVSGLCPDSVYFDSIFVSPSGSGLTVDLGNDTTVCAGDLLTLNSGFISNPGTLDIVWSPGGATSSTFFPSSSGQYFATVDSAGCIGEDSIFVSIGQSNAQITSIDTFFCIGSSLTLNSAGSIGDTLNWYNAAGNSYLGSSATINVNTAGNYYLVAIDTINAVSCSDTAFITVTEQSCSINSSFTPLYDTVCINTLIDTLAYNNSDGDTAWLWNFGSGANPQTSTDSIPTNILYTTGGYKNLSLIVWGPNGSDTTFFGNAIFVKGQLGTANIGLGGQTSTTIDFNWAAVTGATSYSYKIENITQVTSTGITPAVGLPPYTVTATSVNSLDSVCITVYYSNDCSMDSITYCTQAGASNCNVSADIAFVPRVCIGEPICFDINTVVLPNTNGIVDPTNWSVIWNDDVLSDGDSTYCISDADLLLPGNHCIPYTIYSTDPGSDCYAQSFICYSIFDSITGSLNATGYPLPPNEANFSWTPVSGAWRYEVNYTIFPLPGISTGWIIPDNDGQGVGNPADPNSTSHFININDGLTLNDSIVFLVRAISDTACSDTLYAVDTISIIENFACNISYLKPDNIDNACALDTYRLCLNIFNPADWEVNWNGTGYQAYADCYDFYAANPNTNYIVPFQIRQISDPTCFRQDTIRINTGVREDPYWLTKTDFCISDFPFQIDINRVIQTGVFSEVGHNGFHLEAVKQVNGKWFFYPAIAGAGTHRIMHTVCGDTLSRVFTVSGIPCVTTVVSDLGGRPDGVYTTCNGDVYYSDSYRHSIWKIKKSTGVRQLLLGNASLAYGGIVGPTVSGNATTGIDSDIDRDGHRSIARIAYPKGLVVAESTGMIYFNDAKNHKVKMYNPFTQVVTTVVGPANRAFGDIPAGATTGSVIGSNAILNQPWGMTIDCDDNNLFIIDALNRKVRRVQIPDGGVFGATYNVSNEAGGGFLPIAGPTPGLGTSLDIAQMYSHPTLDGDNLYFLAPNNMNMYVHDVNTGIIDVFMPTNFGFGFYADGLEGPGRIQAPSGGAGLGTAVRSGSDFVYFSDNGDFSIRTIGTNDSIETVSGKAPFNPPVGFTQSGDVGGPPFVARYGSPTAMKYSVDNFLYVCDYDIVSGVGSLKRIAFGNEALGPFGLMDTLYCLNDPIDTLINPYEIGTYTITQGDSSVLTQVGVSDTFYFNPNIADTYKIRFDGKSGCCDIVDSFELVVLPPPPVILDSIVFSCDPSTTVITPDSINSGWIYSWLDTNDVEISTNDTLFGVGEGSYYLFITDTLSGCTGMDSTLVQVGFSDTLRISGANTICFGDSVLLSIDTTAFQNWWWNTGDSTHEIYADASGDYIAFASVGACITTDTFRVTQNLLPNICINTSIDTTYGRWISGTLAGDTTINSGYNDAQGLNARFDSPWDVLYVDGFLYVSEGGNNNLIRRIDLSDTTVTTFAGTLGGGLTVDSVQKNNAQFIGPTGISYNKNSGDFYFTNDVSNTLLRIHNDSIFIVAGQNGFGTGYIEGGLDPKSALFSRPKDNDIDAFGSVYMADYDNHVIRKYNPLDNSLTSITGTPGSAGIVDGAPGVAKYTWPWGVGRGKDGKWIIPTESHNIRQIDTAGITSTLAGPGSLTSGYVDGSSVSARFDNPWNVYVCPQGNSYLTDGNNASVRVVDKNGNTSTIAGSTPWGYRDGDQSISKFWVPTGITADPSTGTMYVADRLNHLIRTIVKNKSITICEGLPDTLDASCSLQGNETDFYWVNVNGDTIRNATILADTGGVFTFHVIDVNGCYASDSVIVNELPSPIIDANGGLDTLIICDNSDAILEATPFGFTSTTWYDGSGNVISTDSITTVSSPGTYIVEVYDTVNNAFCPSFDTLNVIPIEDTISIIGNNNTLCFGDSTLLTIADTSAFLSWWWNTGDSTHEIYANASGDYVASGELPGGCVVTDTFRILVNPLPEICVISAQDTLLGKYIVSTVAGDTTGIKGYIDGAGNTARFEILQGVHYSNGSLYLADAHGNNNLVREVNLSNSVVSTFAGTPSNNGSFFDTTIIANNVAQFAFITDIASNGKGSIFTLEKNRAIRRSINGNIEYLAGNPYSAAFNEIGSRTNVGFDSPRQIAYDGIGNIYIADVRNHNVKSYSLISNESYFVAGDTNTVPSSLVLDAQKYDARFGAVRGIDVGVDGNVYVTDVDSSGGITRSLRAIDLDGNVTTINNLNTWHNAIVTDKYGNYFMTVPYSGRIKKYDRNGNFVRNIGAGGQGYSDGYDFDAQFNFPIAIDMDRENDIIYVVDRDQGTVRQLIQNKTVTLCEGLTDTLDASCSNAVSYSWTDLNTNIVTNSPQLIVDTTGSYLISIVDANGCTNTDTIFVNIIPSPVPDINTMTAGRLDSIFGCEGDTIVLNADSIDFTSYNWISNAPFIGLATDSIISTDTSGRYIIEVYNSTGCPGYDTVDVILSPLPNVPNLDTNLCFGETYTVDLSSYGFDSIVWNGNINSTQLLLDSTGSYAFEGFLNSCSLLDTVDFYIADSINVNINGGGDTIYACVGDSALLEAFPYGFGNYLWSPNGEIDSAIYAYTGGTYIVTVSDSAASQCTTADTVEVVFVPAPVLGLNGDTVYICNGESAIFSPSIGNLPVGVDTILFSSGDTVLNSNDSVVLSTTGWYYATATLGSCGDYDSVFISIINPIILTPNIPGINCGADTFNIGGTPTASGGSGQGFIYQWHSFSADTARFTDSTISNPSIIFDTSGTYTFTLTVYDSANPSCFADTTFTFYTGLLPGEVEDLGPDSIAVCGDDTVCFNFSQYNFNQIVWIFRDQASNILGVSSQDSICLTYGDITTSGNFLNVELSTVVDLGGGCVYPSAGANVDDITIYFANPIIVDAGNDTAICPAESIVLGGNPTASGGSELFAPNPFTYNWSVNTGITPSSVSNPSINPTDSSFYILTVIDTVANCSVTDSVNVDVFIVPSIDAGNDVTICATDTTVLTGIITPFDNSLTIAWSPNNGTLSDSTLVTTGAFPLDTTTYYLTVTDSIGCAALSDSVIVNVNTNPIADFIADTVCADSSTTLLSTSIGTLTWVTNGQTFNGPQISVLYGNGGSYTVELIADNGGCADTMIGQILVDTIPTAYAGEDTSYCITDTVSLIGATGSGNITWSTGNGGVFNNNTIINPIFTPDTNGTDTLNLAIIDGNGCRNSDQVVLTFAPIPNVNAGNYNSGCSGTGILLSQATGTGVFSWSTNGDGTFDSTGNLNANYLFGTNDLLNGNVTLTLTATSNPCPSVSDTSSLGINPSAEAVITATVSGGGTVVDSLVEIFVDEGVTFDYLQSTNYSLDSTGWDIDGDGVVDDLNSNYFQLFSDDGSSYLYLYATNEFGCFDWDTIRVDVIGNQVVFIPNVFSPNDVNPDNNVLKVFGTNVLDNDAFDFKIYNRWGELVFDESSFSIMNTNGWNGINENTGEEMPLGVYTYTVQGEFRDGQTFEKVGNVTLIR